MFYFKKPDQNKNLPLEILNRAFSEDPLIISLVLKGIKPSGYMTLDPKENIKGISFTLFTLKDYPRFVYYFEPWGRGCINLAFFNLDACEEILPKLNYLQNSFSFTRAEDLVEVTKNFYANRRKSRKLPRKNKLDFGLVQGISFGYPEYNVLSFLEEQKTGVLRGDRKGVHSDKSRSLVFISYPESEDESNLLMESWNQHKPEPAPLK